MYNYIYILGMILFTVYGQIIQKWRIAGLEISIPNESNLTEKLLIHIQLIFAPFVFSAFMSLTRALVRILEFVTLGEPMTMGKVDAHPSFL